MVGCRLLQVEMEEQDNGVELEMVQEVVMVPVVVMARGGIARWWWWPEVEMARWR